MTILNTQDDRQHILVIGGKDHSYQRINDLGYRFSAIQIPSLVTDYQKNQASHLIVTDYKQVALCTEQAVALYQQDPFAIVVSFSEFSQATAAAIAEQLALPTNCDKQAITLTRDKHLMREKLKGSTLPQVASEVITTKQQLLAFLAKTNEPVIAKPKNGAGSMGVYYIENEQQIDDAISHCLSVEMGEVLAETYIGGDEFSVESLSKAGDHEIVMVTQKTTSHKPYFVETGHQQPANLDPTSLANIKSTVSQLLTLVGHQYGPAHTEVKLFNEKVYIIETQLRFGGDQIWEMTLLVSGVDLVKETISALMQGPAMPRVPQYQGMVNLFLMHPYSETQIQQWLDEYQLQSCLVRAQFSEQQQNHQITHSEARLGYLLFGFNSTQLPPQWPTFYQKIVSGTHQ